MKMRLVGALLLVVGIGLGGYGLLCKGSAQGEAACQMQVKDHLITGVYKSYGLKDCAVPMWVAKVVFKNGTSGRLTNLKFRYKLGEYSDWCPWHSYVAVDPTQTVVDLYHPILSSACARLTSRAPAELQMECEYTDASGKKQEMQETKRITMLGRHEFYFGDLSAEERTAAFQDFDTYSPLLAAWVSRQDAPVARLASLANKKAGGLGASTDDESCVRVMKELYDIMRTIHISYQHPQAMADPTMSYDIKLVQSLQYPRDTIEKRSGTCIDLAILYAALLNSVNITPYLVSMDGHCFPIGQAPSGNFIPVEATGVGDGAAKSMTFVQAYESAMKTWKQVNQNGRFNLVDVRTCWMNGVSNPELEGLPADILEKWGITALVDGGGREGPARPDPPPQPERPQPPEPPQPPQPQVNVAGQWAYTVTPQGGVATRGQFQIAVQGNQLVLVAAAAYQLPGPDGNMHQFTERNSFTGILRGLNIMAECNNAQYTMDGMQVPPQGLPLKLVLQVSQDGRSMRGQVTNAQGQSAAIGAQR